MKISAQEEYGLRCILQLARKGADEIGTIPEIAGKEGLSVEYTGKLMMLLRHAHLVESLRGKNGGYVLGAVPEEISLGQVMRALSKPLFLEETCDDYPGQVAECVHRRIPKVLAVLFEEIGARSIGGDADQVGDGRPGDRHRRKGRAIEDLRRVGTVDEPGVGVEGHGVPNVVGEAGPERRAMTNR